MSPGAVRFDSCRNSIGIWPENLSQSMIARGRNLAKSATSKGSLNNIVCLEGDGFPVADYYIVRYSGKEAV